MTIERQAVHVATKSGEPRGIQVTEETFDPSGLAVTVSGELDIATAPALRDRLNEAIDAGTYRFVIDLSAVSFLDSVALATIVHAKQRLPEGGRMAIATESRFLRDADLREQRPRERARHRRDARRGDRARLGLKPSGAGGVSVGSPAWRLSTSTS